MSPSFSERIDEYRQRAASKQHAEDEGHLLRAEVVKKAIQLRKNQDLVDREKRRSTLEESGILGLLQEAKDHLPWGQRQQVVIAPDCSTAFLIWGRRFKIGSDGSINKDKGLIGNFEELDFNIIQADVELDGTIQVREKAFPEQEWRNNPQALIDKVAECFISPEESQYPGPPGSSGIQY